MPFAGWEAEGGEGGVIEADDFASQIGAFNGRFSPRDRNTHDLTIDGCVPRSARPIKVCHHGRTRVGARMTAHDHQVVVSMVVVHVAEHGGNNIRRKITHTDTIEVAATCGPY